MRRALGTVSVVVVAVVLVTIAVVRSRSAVPPLVAQQLAVVNATTSTVAPTTTTSPPPPPAAPAQPAAPREPPAPRVPLPPATPALTGPFTIATATGSSVPIFDAPNGTVKMTLASPNEDYYPRIFLVRSRVDATWLDVYLPVRPNESTGFIRTSDVQLSSLLTQIKVEIGYHRLTAWNGTQQVAQYPVAVGKPSTPTPTGVFYLQELVKTPNPGGAYGPYVYGLSSHSNVYEKFGNGDGLVGLHGTNEPGSIGHSASHGCIRMPNAGIANLVQIIPVGSPIVVVP